MFIKYAPTLNILQVCGEVDGSLPDEAKSPAPAGRGPQSPAQSTSMYERGDDTMTKKIPPLALSQRKPVEELAVSYYRFRKLQDEIGLERRYDEQPIPVLKDLKFWAMTLLDRQSKLAVKAIPPDRLKDVIEEITGYIEEKTEKVPF